MNPRIEPLEARDLMTAALIDGTLLIEGTRKADAIALDVTADAYTVEGKTFAKSDVQRIRVEGRGGFDTVKVNLPLANADQAESGHDQLFRCGTFDRTTRYTGSMSGIPSFGTVGVSVNADHLDRFFSFRTESAKKGSGGFVLDISEPVLAVPGPVEPLAVLLLKGRK